jgi:hypothetical protein
MVIYARISIFMPQDIISAGEVPGEQTGLQNWLWCNGHGSNSCFNITMVSEEEYPSRVLLDYIVP